MLRDDGKLTVQKAWDEFHRPVTAVRLEDKKETPQTPQLWIGAIDPDVDNFGVEGLGRLVSVARVEAPPPDPVCVPDLGALV